MKVISIHKTSPNKGLSLPLYSSRVSAGFPSPAEEHIERSLDLHEHLVKHPAATFFVRAEGNSMEGVGIYSGDILVVDRSLEPKDDSIVIAVVDGELTVKRLKKQKGKWFLYAENPAYEPIPITKHIDFVVWGVVTNAIHEL